MISNSCAGVIVILQVNYFIIQFYNSIDWLSGPWPPGNSQLVNSLLSI